VRQPRGCGQVLVDRVLVPGRYLVRYLVGTWQAPGLVEPGGTRYKHQVLVDQASKLHQLLLCSQPWQHPGMVPIFEQNTRAPSF